MPSRLRWIRVLCAGLLAVPLVAWAAPAQATTRTQFSLVSASILAGGAEAKATVTITCSASSADLYVTVSQKQPSGAVASRLIDFTFACSGAIQKFTAPSYPDSFGTEARLHAGPAAVELDYYNWDTDTEVQHWTNVSLAPGALHSVGLGNTAKLIGSGGVFEVLATITCKPGGQYEPVATVSQPISSTTVEVGESWFDPYSGGPDIPCTHSPLAISVPVPGYNAAFHAGPAFVWLSIYAYRGSNYSRIYGFTGVVTAVPPSQPKEVEAAP